MQLQMGTAPACRAHEADVEDVRSCRVPFEPGEDGILRMRTRFGGAMLLTRHSAEPRCGAAGWKAPP